MRFASKAFVLFSVVVGIALNGDGQNRANIWELSPQDYFPACGVDFNQGYADTFSMQRKLAFFETNASICDTNGQILFYTNGQWIANRNNDSLSNCFKFNAGFLTDTYYGGQGGNGMSQGAIAIPDPSNSNRYYLFYETAQSFINHQYGFNDYQPFYLSYSIIDMTMDHGLGGIPKGSKNIHAIDDTLLYGMITACKHSNGRDWWIVVHKYNSNEFYSVLLDSNGVSKPNIQIAGPMIKPLDEILGQLFSSDNTGEANFSPDGNHYCFVEVGFHVRLFDFDRCTGLLFNFREDSLPLLEQYDNSTLGCSFSPDSKFLYVSTYWHLFQYNASSLNIRNERDSIARYNYSLDSALLFYNAWFSFEQLAPDNKIYMCPWNYNIFYNVIDQPDNPGANCNFLQNGLALPPLDYSEDIPNFPNYDLGPVGNLMADAGSNDTIVKGESVQLGIPPVAGVKYQWKTNPTLSDTTIAQPIATPDSTTIYYVTFTDTSTNGSCNLRDDTVTVFVRIATAILPKPENSISVRVTPNPASEWLNIIYQSNDDALFQLYDQFGVRVAAVSLYHYFKNRMLDVSNLPSGIYNYQIEQRNEIAQSGTLAVIK